MPFTTTETTGESQNPPELFKYKSWGDVPFSRGNIIWFHELLPLANVYGAIVATDASATLAGMVMALAYESTGEYCTQGRQASRLAAHLLRALGIIPTANETGNSLLLYSLPFHTPRLNTVQYVPWGLFFLF